MKKKDIKRWKKGVRGIRQKELKEFTMKKLPKKKYSQNWKYYNLAQTKELTLFQNILIELIDNTIQVRKSLYKKGRKFFDFNDMIFSCVMKVYFGKCGRRNTSFLEWAKDKGFIKKVPHFNTIFKYYKSPYMTEVLKHLIEQSARPLKPVEVDFTLDASGFSTRLYGRWFNARMGSYRRRKLFVKTNIMSGVKTNIISSVEILKGYHHESPGFEGLVRTTARYFDIREVSADKAYSSKKNLGVVSEVGGIPFIPFRKSVKRARGYSIWKSMYEMYHKHQEEFLKHYHKRSNAESVFNMIKRKFGTSLLCNTETAQINELLCICLCHNICVLISEMYNSHIELNFKGFEKLFKLN